MRAQLLANGQLRVRPVSQSIWGHLQREILIINWSVMEVVLYAPLAYFFLPWARFWPSLSMAFLLLSVMQLAFNLSRIMSLLSLRPDIQRNVMVLAFILLLLLALRILLYQLPPPEGRSRLSEFYENMSTQRWSRDLSLFLLLTFMWWRGIRLSQQSFSISKSGLRLRVGGLLITPLVVWSTRQLDWDVTIYILLFFWCGVSVAAQARAEQNERDLTGKSAFLGPAWMVSIFAAGLLIVLMAGLSAIFVNGDSALLIFAGLMPLRVAVNLGGAAVLSIIVHLSAPLFGLLEIVAAWISTLFVHLLGSVMSEPFTIDLGQNPLGEATTEAIERANPFQDSGRIIALLLMLALVLIVALALGRRYQQSTSAYRPLESIRPNLRQPGKSGSLRESLLNRLGLLRQWRASASIRRVYQEMSTAASASGYPRSKAETPFEYLDSLGKVWPANTSDSKLITEAYVRVRYGELPETKQELNDIMSAWTRLKRTQPATLESRSSTFPR